MRFVLLLLCIVCSLYSIAQNDTIVDSTIVIPPPPRNIQLDALDTSTFYTFDGSMYGLHFSHPKHWRTSPLEKSEIAQFYTDDKEFLSIRYQNKVCTMREFLKGDADLLKLLKKCSYLNLRNSQDIDIAGSTGLEESFNASLGGGDLVIRIITVSSKKRTYTLFALSSPEKAKSFEKQIKAMLSTWQFK